MALGHFADIVAKNERDGYFTVGLMATCPSMPGLVAGLQHSGPTREPIKIGMLWLDAHPDFNTPETTRSGSLGGMPVAVATGRALQRLRLDARLDPPLSDRHIVMGGVRLTDPLEQHLLDQSFIEQLSVDDLRNMTPAVFAQYPTPGDLAEAKPADVEELIHSTGFFRQKTKSLIGMGAALEERFDGQVPTELEDLVTLPGVGRKTGNVIRSVAFGLPGLPVDTHVGRLSRRLGLTEQNDPVKVELELNGYLPAILAMLQSRHAPVSSSLDPDDPHSRYFESEPRLGSASYRGDRPAGPRALAAE